MDVIFRVNDHLARGGQNACEAVELSSPVDLGRSGLSNTDVAAVLSRKLATTLTARARTGKIAIHYLIVRLNGVAVPRVTETPLRSNAGHTTRQQ